MPQTFDDLLEIGLECAHWWRAHFLAMEDEFGELKTNACVVDCGWDLSLDKSNDSSGSTSKFC